MVSRIGTPALVSTPIVCRHLVIYRQRERVLISGRINFALSHHNRPTFVRMNRHKPTSAAPTASNIKIQYLRRKALVAIKTLVGVGSRCSLPAKTAINLVNKHEQEDCHYNRHNSDDHRINAGRFDLSTGLGFPVQILWFLFFSIILALIVHYHQFGNWIFATGDNQTAARAMGINTDRVKIICFVIVGVLCAFMSMLQALRIESFAATQGIGFELKAIASSVVGGTSLMGGVGSILGIFLGTLTIQILENGLILMGAPVFGINVFIGIGIVLFAVLNQYIERIAIR